MAKTPFAAAQTDFGHEKSRKTADLVYACKPTGYGRAHAIRHFKAMQKAMNYAAKDGLLQRKRPLSALQNIAFCGANGGISRFDRTFSATQLTVLYSVNGHNRHGNSPFDRV